ncbi:response regulator transcription factor [Actibacterium ureilyticum]|uniref:response regulator transcription factor n=1 Tax=Actibacterium ureilyticum TaxID=1590614 RepID=UPI000BAB1C4D|nr:response regulator transcription factor [Actibacterium ureilyticum]
MRILVAEDDAVLSEQLRAALTADGHAVDVEPDGEEVAFLGATEPYDLVVLDLGLPTMDGLAILKQWRADHVALPVLILTARDGWSDRVQGLDAGADDYLTKPFHMPELCARVRALLRRNSGVTNPIFERGDLRFDTRSGAVTRQGEAIRLTAQELAVLSYLVHNAGRLVSRMELSEHIYDYNSDRDSNTIAVFVTRLRKKLGADLIATTRGRGYMIAGDE